MIIRVTSYLVGRGSLLPPQEHRPALGPSSPPTFLCGSTPKGVVIMLYEQQSQLDMTDQLVNICLSGLDCSFMGAMTVRLKAAGHHRKMHQQT